MEEADRIFECEFCRSRLYISPRENFHLFLAPREPDPDHYFLPYWRFKGIEFGCDDLQVTGKITDSSYPGRKAAAGAAFTGRAAPGAEAALYGPRCARPFH